MKRFISLCLLLLVTLLPGITKAENSNNSQAIDELTCKIASETSWKLEDIHLLARVIHAEARGENYVGKVAVGAVVINRIKSPDFPNTLEEVVFQKRAFTCVNDGQINYDPDIESYKAAFDAVLGKDPTNGCVFYHNPKIATSRWMHKRISAESATVIGNHVFGK